ncbi:class I SAM-dependent methyltransferase [Ottowia thiooxydans]|uniref:class I SAM-dependent methyltransferase n=1 Tax=Ottowia thiooxydans TaxID=219182 RepID=UPI00048D2B03|nr:class I SAM-dependent methyltransferase [Ottowia thiooxydans]
MTTTEEKDEYGSDYAAWQVDRSNSFVRRLIKGFYIRKVLSEIDGPTIDFGCGAGQILRKLPKQSVGLEVNKSLVELHRQRGLDVRFYDAFADDFSFSLLTPGFYKTLVISHVLEHFENADEILRRLCKGALLLGLNKIVIVVPGKVGYESDATHRTYIDAGWVDRHNLRRVESYAIEKLNYFPVNQPSFGDRFIYNEMHLVYSIESK